MTPCDWFNERRINVTSRVCERCIAAHDHEAARYAWTRLTRLISQRMPEWVAVLESQMVVR